MAISESEQWERPFFLPPNRVRRSYQGGYLLEKFRGYPQPGDGWFPEDWIASVTASRTGTEPDEGLSPVRFGMEEIRLRDLILRNPRAMLGADHNASFGPDPYLLVKLLDSRIRLRLQVHPGRQAAQKLFRAAHGKTEAWIVMETRRVGAETPHILLGFREGVTEEAFREAVFDPEQRGLLELFHKITVQPRDVFYIQGGTPHAIGPGVFMVEVQEPSDDTIFVEPRGKDLRAEGSASHLGLGWETALDCFHYEGISEAAALQRWRIAPRLIRDEAGGRVEALLYGPEIAAYFGAARLTVRKALTMHCPSFYIAIVTRGAGRIRSRGGSERVARGDALFLPAALGGHRWEAAAAEGLEVIACYPPQPGAGQPAG